MRAFVDGLRAEPRVEVVAGLTHDEAEAWDGDWSSVDVLVVDAADDRRKGDHFPAVGLVRGLRAAVPGEKPLVVVVTGHYFHEGLRHRMAAAGADLFFLRSEIREPEDLVDVVLNPQSYRRGVPAPAETGTLTQLGVGPESDLEGFVGYVDNEGLGPDFDPNRPKRDEPRSRRWTRHRSSAAEAGGIDPVNMTTGQPPLDQDVPSIRQLSRLWAWAARVRRPD